MASGGQMVQSQYFEPPKDAPKYLLEALEDLGTCEEVVEKRKKISNPTVDRYMDLVEGHHVDMRTRPWCAYFVGAKLEECGIPSSKSGMARSYIKWSAGESVSTTDGAQWKVGDIVIFWRGPRNDGVTGHVAFLLSWDSTFVYCLGGNQGDKVSIQAFRRSKIIGISRYRHWTKSRTVKAAAATATTVVIDKTVELASIPPPPKVSVESKVHAATKALKVLEDAREPMSTLAQWRPTLAVVFSLATVALLGYIAWRRAQDMKGKKK